MLTSDLRRRSWTASLRGTPVTPVHGIGPLPDGRYPVGVTFPVVGMVGGGQLARMTHEAGIPLGIRFKLLSDTPQDSAAQVVSDVVIGDYRDLDTLRDFARGCDVITFDHEHVPTEHLRALEADGIPVRPGPDALVHAQDKGVMRAKLDELGVPCPRHRIVKDPADVVAFAAEGATEGDGFPVVLKTVRGGYDGKGVWVVRSPEQAEETQRLELLITVEPDGMFGPHLDPATAGTMLDVEGGTWAECMNILRHEAGHTVQHSYQLQRRRRWQQRLPRPGDHPGPYGTLSRDRSRREEAAAADRRIG